MTRRTPPLIGAYSLDSMGLLRGRAQTSLSRFTTFAHRSCTFSGAPTYPQQRALLAPYRTRRNVVYLVGIAIPLARTA